ncbi:MAG: hypothetical protein P1U70_17880 [Saprospiraceae bacterium]|nr:hypothetical protein [Saprospiraceae bacterium]
MNRALPLLTLFVLYTYIANCQQQSTNWNLPPTDSLFAAIEKHHATITAAQLAEFDETTTKKWMNYIPSVGIGYTPSGDPRPTASFSLSQIITAKRNQQDRERRRASILAKSEIELQNLKSQLASMIQEYELLKRELRTREQIHEIDKQLFQLAKTQYENAEMSPVEFLPKEKAFLLQGLEIEIKKAELLKMKQKILIFIK